METIADICAKAMALCLSLVMLAACPEGADGTNRAQERATAQTG